MTLSWVRRPQHTNRMQRLLAVSLFATLTPRELGIIDSMMHERHYLADEIVFDEGEEGQAFYVLLSGRVRISRSVGNDTEMIAELEAGNFFGDLALLDNTPRSAQARAAENCDIAVFFRADFSSLLESNAVIGYKISLELARLISRRLRTMMANSAPEAL